MIDYAKKKIIHDTAGYLSPAPIYPEQFVLLETYNKALKIFESMTCKSRFFQKNHEIHAIDLIFTDRKILETRIIFIV